MTEPRRVHGGASSRRAQIAPELASTSGGVGAVPGADRGSAAASRSIAGPDRVHRHAVARRRRIHFAGEHTPSWTVWMQGAIDSARRVVREIMARA